MSIKAHNFFFCEYINNIYSYEEDFMSGKNLLKYTVFFTGVLITINVGLLYSFFSLLTKL